jgi:predicted RNA-binding protein with PUA-like domain
MSRYIYPNMAYWLIKSEESKYSISDLKRDKKTEWHGVRNYQARNFLKSMKKGDLVIYYHSVDEPIGVAGIAEVQVEAIPDSTQFDNKSEYYDETASKENPRWWCPIVKFVEKFPRVFTTKEIRALKGLGAMELLRPRSRLSVQQVSPEQFKIIVRAAREE